MAGGAARAVKSTQEQAVASWITYLNQIRLDELIARLNQQDINLEEALKELAQLKEFIANPEHILGSQSTKHGEIAEHVQVCFSNARRLIQGLERDHTFEGVGRTAKEDYLRNSQMIQSKFNNGVKNTLNAVKMHLADYPDFVNNGGAYDIPKDQYEDIVRLLKLADTNPSSLTKAEWSLIEAIRAFERDTGLSVVKDLNPAVVNYDAVQLNQVNDTIAKEEDDIKEEDQKQRRKAYDQSKPTVKEGVKAAAASAVIEGGLAFCMAVASKLKEGKKLFDFNEEDWKEVGIQSGTGALKGGIRGGTIYTLTNFTATPANVASAYVTAAFGVAAQAAALKRGEISQDDFVINCETVCLDVSVSAVASLAGQVLIPIPVLGAVIGNLAGECAYELCEKYAGQQAQKIISGYNCEMEQLKQQLDIRYRMVVLEIQMELMRFADLEKMAFDEEINKAFAGSVRLALETGVEESRILKNLDEIDAYFLL